MRREFALVLLLGAAGAGLVVLAVRETWAQAIFTAPRPLPVQDFSVTGQELVPLAGALALAALACLAAVIATRSVVRRIFGALLALLGAGTVAAVTAGVRASTVLSAARANASNGTFGGSTTSGTSPGDASHPIVIAGSSGRAVMAGVPWRAVAVVGAVAIILAGLATVWRGQRWSVMSSRFDRPSGGFGGAGSPPKSRGGLGGVAPPGQHSSATMWEALSRDIDPTVEGRTDPTDQVGADQPILAGQGTEADQGARADQLDGGTRT